MNWVQILEGLSYKMARSNKFQAYDYGKDGNIQHYNQPDPPVYNISMMNVPTALFTATNDWLADPQDVATLIPKIRNLIFHNNQEDWNHLDFVWGIDADKKIYPDIIKLMDKVTRGHFK